MQLGMRKFKISRNEEKLMFYFSSKANLQDETSDIAYYLAFVMLSVAEITLRLC